MEWETSGRLVPYEDAAAVMEARAAAIALQQASECVWLLEHPAIYTAGTSADLSELLAPGRFPVFKTGRGGRFTYHGPG
ncbi:MAG: lipoyl protein ligase domain-containing protein, partial [Mycobacterium sp.]